MEVAQPFQFWFQVISMEPSANFEQREEHGEWRPPRPQNSNVPTGDNSDQKWYNYYDGHTTEVQRPDENLATHFKTYSFYFDNNIFWIYPCNAILNEVGDGSIHPPRSSDSSPDEVGDGSSNFNSDEDDNSVEDWRPLAFYWDFSGANAATSCATFRALHDELQVQRENQAWIPEVLPDRYHASAERRNSAAGTGGLVGKLPILIALIVFSVTPEQVSSTLMHCLQQNYNTHGQTRGHGWIPRRGVVIRVLRQMDGEQAGQPPEDNPAFQRMRRFEYGRFGQGNFFP